MASVPLAILTGFILWERETEDLNAGQRSIQGLFVVRNIGREEVELRELPWQQWQAVDRSDERPVSWLVSVYVFSTSWHCT